MHTYIYAYGCLIALKLYTYLYLVLLIYCYIYITASIHFSLTYTHTPSIYVSLFLYLYTHVLIQVCVYIYSNCNIGIYKAISTICIYICIFECGFLYAYINICISIDWSAASASIQAVAFVTHASLTTRELAHMLDSLVRVSRRVEKNHSVILGMGAQAQPASPPTSSLAAIRSPMGEFPCPRRSPRRNTEDDAPGKNHCARPDQNP